MASMFQLQDDGSSSVTSSSPLQFFSMMSLSPGTGCPYGWLKELKSEERGLYLIHLLLTCASHVASGSLESADAALDQISRLASPGGDTMQRVAAYFGEALAERVLKSWPGIHKALNSTRISPASDEILVSNLFFELLPFLRVAFVLTNQAITEAVGGEKMVHIIDLHAREPAQWIALLRVLSARPEGPPHLRITAVHRRKEVLDHMARRLTEEAEKLDVPFQFNPMPIAPHDLDFGKLGIKTGEALVVSSVLQLHALLARGDKQSLGSNGSPDSASSSPAKMDNFLNSLWGLSPRLVVVTEQDSNHNGPTLMERLLEALHSYAALFDCLESAASSRRAPAERLGVEKALFGEEIKDIIAQEGSERKERHERLDSWVRRLGSAGFVGVPLSYYGVLQATRLVEGYGCDGYKIREENGNVLICWQDRPLYSVSAWRCRK